MLMVFLFVLVYVCASCLLCICCLCRGERLLHHLEVVVRPVHVRNLLRQMTDSPWLNTQFCDLGSGSRDPQF